MAGSAEKAKTLVVFRPMINWPPAHPDTAITTLVNLERALNSFGIQYTYLTVDLQLYQTACLAQWNDSLRWAIVILGCIETLMKASGVDILTNEALAFITSTISGKAWTNGLIIAVLLYNFYFNCAKTYEELIVYLETVRENQTGRLWGDCFVKPTLMSMPAGRAERWFPSPAALSQGNAAILLLSRSPQLCPLPELVCATDGAPSPACQRGPTGRYAHLSALGLGAAMPADQFGEQTYIKRNNGSGGMKGISTSGCVGE